MPIDPVSVGVAGAAIVGQGINAMAQSSMNRKTRKWSEQQYDKQRGHALEDWQRQNDYNSPLAQMNRLKDAGLNPNLVYGATAPGNSSGPVHSATPPQWSPKAPQFDGASPIASYYDTATRSATLDNIRAMNDKIKAETAATEASAGLRQTQLKYSGQFYSNQAGKMGYDADSARLTNEMKTLLQDPDAYISDNPRARESVAYQEAVTKLNNLGLDTKIKQQLEKGQNKDNVIKDMEIELRKNGINPNDPLWARILGRMLAKYVDIRNW